jgi:deazaflavin-dependent oxidoreductase (nitroreductase family)
MAPLIRSGFGWTLGSPMNGWYFILRTRGRRSGVIREAPLGYVIRDGAVYCVAGYGRSTPWVLNLVADPSVEAILPTRRFHGWAELVTDPAEWLGAYRALIASFGLLGRTIVGDVPDLDDTGLLARHGVLPVIRITPNPGEPPLVPGAFDPGGRGWLVSWGAQLALGILALRWLASRRGR